MEGLFLGVSILLLDGNPSVSPGTSPENTVAITSTQKRAVKIGIVQTSSLRDLRVARGWSWVEEFIVKMACMDGVVERVLTA